MDIGKVVKNARKHLLLSQSDFARTLNLSRSSINKLEKNQGDCCIGTLRKLAPVFEGKNLILPYGFDPFQANIGSFLATNREKRGFGVRFLARSAGVSRREIKRLEAASGGDTASIEGTRIGTVMKIVAALEK